jgi:hypothetical protein
MWVPGSFIHNPPFDGLSFAEIHVSPYGLNRSSFKTQRSVGDG